MVLCVLLLNKNIAICISIIINLSNNELIYENILFPYIPVGNLINIIYFRKTLLHKVISMI